VGRKYLGERIFLIRSLLYSIVIGTTYHVSFENNTIKLLAETGALTVISPMLNGLEVAILSLSSHLY
jgi:hypothetical protein